MALMLQYPCQTSPSYSSTCTFRAPRRNSSTYVNASSKRTSSSALNPLGDNKTHVFTPPKVYRPHAASTKGARWSKVTRKVVPLRRVVPRIVITPPPPPTEERVTEEEEGVPEGSHDLLHSDSAGASTLSWPSERGMMVRFWVGTGQEFELEMQHKEFRYLVAKGMLQDF
ncbi:MAG: hypothetical protein LQ346_006270 [Caloplaca aetnensis]|nr:MAG: hypothetical protein LQ346_006270 [Caloplaca aetnensis]